MRTVRKKRRLWRTYTETRDYQDFLAYKKVEDHVKKAVRNAKKSLEKNLAKNAKANPKAFYKYLNSHTANKQTVGPLKDNDTIDHVQANLTSGFCGFFHHFLVYGIKFLFFFILI